MAGLSPRLFGQGVVHGHVQKPPEEARNALAEVANPDLVQDMLVGPGIDVTAILPATTGVDATDFHDSAPAAMIRP